MIYNQEKITLKINPINTKPNMPNKINIPIENCVVFVAVPPFPTFVVVVPPLDDPSFPPFPPFPPVVVLVEVFVEVLVEVDKLFLQF